MDKMLKIAILITAIDKASQINKEATDKMSRQMQALKKQSQANFGKGGALLAASAGISMAIATTVKDFAQLEESGTRLETAMMNSAGQTSAYFKDVNKLAISLGDKLPGTTADFQNMFRELLNNGTKAQDILGGVGKAAAYLAVDLKMPYEEAAAFSAKMKAATGVANEDFMKFMDTISRTATLGVQTDEMRYAFGRSSGALKLMGIQGLKASNDMAVLYASMIRLGASGETVGTSFSTIINSLLDSKKMGKMKEIAAQSGISFNFFKNGKFLGVENMVSEFSKLKNLSIQQRASIINALTGGGQDGAMLQNIITMGLDGYQKIRAEMENKASLDAKVQKQLGTLNQIWEATTGTVTNLSAQFASALAPELKRISEAIGRIAGKTREFLEKYPTIAKIIAMVAGGAAVFMALAGAVYITAGAFQAMSVAMTANPIGLIIVGIIMVIAQIAILVYKWDALYKKFKEGSPAIKAVMIIFAALNIAVVAIAYAIRTIIKHWDSIKEFFINLGNIFNKIVYFIVGVGKTMFQAGKNIILSIWNGMKSVAMMPVNLIAGIVKKIRNFLPFSPAKEGPLRDIHRIRLIETIAENIKPAKAITAMRQAIGAIVNVGVNGAPAARAQVAGGGQVTVNFNVTVNGGNGQDIVSQLKQYEPELLRLINNAMARKDRRMF